MTWLGAKAAEFSDEFTTLRQCLRFLIRNPPVVLPLLGAWFACVAIVFQGIPLIPWKRLDWTTALLAIWALNAAVNFVTLFACSMLLELLQHQETGRPLRLGRAFRDTVFRNSWILLPLAAVWSLIEIALWTVEILLRRGSDNDSDSAVSTLSEIVQKGLRMGLFLTLPAVAWEEAGPIAAIGRAYRLARRHIISFLGAMTLSGLFMAFAGLPLAIGWYAAPEWMREHHLLVIAASAVLWTLKIYLEQMMMAELYLYARCCEWDDFRQVQDPLSRGTSGPQIIPSLFNGIPDLKERMSIQR